jgi:putative ABC transport system permease protein
MKNLLQDIRYGIRVLLKNPIFTIVSMLTLALGIGANTAVFSVASVFLWRPVSFPGLDRLVIVASLAPGESPLDTDNTSPADYRDWNQRNRSFKPMSAFSWDDVNMTGTGDPQKLTGFRVSSNFFPTLQVQPILGRAFLPEEDQPGRNQEVILSHGLWERNFGSARDVIGKTIQLNQKSYTIVGVMGKEFRFPVAAELWLPLAMGEEEKNDRRSHYLHIVTRLKPGVTLGQAQAEMTAISQRLGQEYPNMDRGWTVRVVSIPEYVAGSYSQHYSALLLGAVVFVLLIVCANVSNLLLARSTARRKEIAVRIAMGAGRWRVVRMLLTESILLGLGGCVFGLLLGQWWIQMILAYMPAEVERFLPFWRGIHLDGWTFAFSLGITLVAGILAGIAPSLANSTPDLTEQLKEGGRGATSGRARHRLRSAFVVAEVALSLVLMIGASLMAKGVHELIHLQRNLHPETLLTLRAQLPESKYKEPAQQAAFYDQVLQRLESLPGAKSATVVSAVPNCDCFGASPFSIEGKQRQPGEVQVAYAQRVGRDFLRVMNVPLLSGRAFASQDGKDNAPVVIVGEDLARRYFPGQDPLGKRIKLGDDDSTAAWATIVGVVGQVQYDWTNRVDFPAIYVPYQQSPSSTSFFAIRTTGDPRAIIPEVRTSVASVDPDQPLFEILSEATVIHNSLVGLYYVAVMLLAMGGMALLLSAVGVYGVMSYAVAEQTHEVGVRMALGAQRRDILVMVFKRAALLTGVGFLIGLPMALALARLLASLLFGVSAADLFIFGLGTFVLAAIAMLACYIPARRAMRLDPMVALRYE